MSYLIGQEGSVKLCQNLYVIYYYLTSQKSMVTFILRITTY